MLAPVGNAYEGTVAVLFLAEREKVREREHHQLSVQVNELGFAKLNPFFSVQNIVKAGKLKANSDHTHKFSP